VTNPIGFAHHGRSIVEANDRLGAVGCFRNSTWNYSDVRRNFVIRRAHLFSGGVSFSFAQGKNSNGRKRGKKL